MAMQLDKRARQLMELKGRSYDEAYLHGNYADTAEEIARKEAAHAAK
jgi:hypothetical protein